ncbi:LOW QUALITY PROTEIN: uncharacterized protein O3Q21_012974 [Podargus strigoides]
MLASLGRLLQAGSGAGEGSGAGRAGCRRGRDASDGVHIAPRYRQFPKLTRRQVIHSEALSGFMWFWIFWHSSDIVLGHFPYPDPAAWTDEELGIPPDNAPAAGAGSTPVRLLSPRGLAVNSTEGRHRPQAACNGAFTLLPGVANRPPSLGPWN